MDKQLEEALKKIIESTIGDMVHEEIKTQFKPIQKTLNDVLEENRKYHDNVTRQITDDRKDLGKLTIDSAKGLAQNKVIIDNQNSVEEKVVEAVREEAQQIPRHTEKAVEKMFNKKPFLKRIKERFKK